ncbi:50S ribosomal protein L9 [Criblamydia sequanensis]|uniref:Large ribosomal subunit protein bL9 n=1 Tax=Candidatus Criblamydia sequanensis CRIB-18 TaxID=1437425 RepID=A0A090CYS7_9BACT|nr:50S ribosomal protein L9 [Criblamydia sequanensis]CDR33847.1 50S ribosomal protein L9 [Criblamydia sequanensis CRIB-18]
MATKLLLIEDVEDLGRSGDIVSVKEGYARNFLLPRGVAVMADKNAIRRQAALKEARLLKAIEDKKEAEVLAKRFDGLNITAIVKVDPEGHMYGSVTAAEIVKLIEDEHKIALEKRYVQLKHPIKELGVHRIDLKLKEGVPATITLKIAPENFEETEAVEQAKSDTE